jgi:hypothetical protein
VAALRPPCPAEVLALDPRDPVFGAPECAVDGCLRPRRQRGWCTGHATRWRAQGPDPAEFTATTNPAFHGHAPLLPCVVPRCGFGRQAHSLCPKHYHRWLRVGRPPRPGWVAEASTVHPSGPPPGPCRIVRCPLWTHAGSAWCVQHWKRAQRPAHRRPGPASLLRATRLTWCPGLLRPVARSRRRPPSRACLPLNTATAPPNTRRAPPNPVTPSPPPTQTR